MGGGRIIKWVTGDLLGQDADHDPKAEAYQIVVRQQVLVCLATGLDDRLGYGGCDHS